MKTHVMMIALLSTLMLIAFGVQSADFEQVQKERSDLMKTNSKANKALRAAAKEGDMAQVEKSASVLASDFAKIPSLFPEGSGEGTRAKPEIWANWSDFEEHARTAQKLAMAVAAAAKAGKSEEVQTLANSLSKQTCSGCHDAYRAPKKKAM